MRSFEQLCREWELLAPPAGGRIAQAAAGADVILAVEFGATNAPCVLLSAGMHGDEPAGIAALASLVRDGLLDQRFSYCILPCVNPSGFRAGTRENASGQDVNRSFCRGGSTVEARACIALTDRRRYVLGVDLHEDREASGFYAYAAARNGQTLPGESVVPVLDRAGCAVQTIPRDFDLGYAGMTDAYATVERGRVVSTFDQQTAAFEGWPFVTYLLADQSESTLVFETPRRLPFAQRVHMHRLAVVNAIAQLRSS